MNTPKNIAAYGRLGPVAERDIKIADQRAKFRIFNTAFGFECLQARLTLPRNAVAPLLGGGKGAFRLQIVGAQCTQIGANGFGIDISHQFANQLFLPSQCAVRAYGPGIANRLGKAVVQLQFPQFHVAEFDELFAERLSFALLAFPLAFAGL